MSKDFLKSSMVDVHLCDLLDAYKNCAKLHESITSPKTKRAVRGIQNSIKLSINNLSPLGVHSEKRFKEAQEKYGLT
jgi:hypothetical protein